MDFANAKSGDGDEFVISYSSFIVRSLAILLSLRGAKRRSNPERENVHALDCFATLAMTEKDGLPRFSCENLVIVDVSCVAMKGNFWVKCIPNGIISIWYVCFWVLVEHFLIIYILKLEKLSLVCICFWFTGWILLKIHTIFLIKQIGMYKGDFLREVCWNFTYLIEKMHFGMYILTPTFFSLIWQLKK